MNVGTRELKNRLSHYLRLVREAGESIYVTDRGEVIAELRPVVRGRKSVRDALLTLTARGELTAGRGHYSDFKPIKPRRAVSIAKIVLDSR